MIIMRGVAFTPEFSACLDSKGRVTIPSEYRDFLGLDEGSCVTFLVVDVSVRNYDVENFDEAMRILQQLDEARNFSYDGSKLKVVLDE